MKKRLISCLLALVMLLGMLPMSILAADAVTVYVTVSDKGVLAADKYGEAMGYRAVTVTDRDSDGRLTVADAYDAAHAQYCDSEFLLNGSGLVGQLWGDRSGAFLTYVNNAGISGEPLNTQTISDGSHLVGAILSDTSYWSDYYSFFDVSATEVTVGQSVILELQGCAGMSWSGVPETAKALKSVPVGLWENGSFSALAGKTTNAMGQVALSFDAAGTYYVTANGSVASTNSVTGSAPIIAPVCIVTVTEEKTPEAYAADDAAALNVSYVHGQSLALPKKGQSGKTDIAWSFSPEGVIDANGTVTQPEADTTVTLTATVSYSGKSAVREFTVTVPGRLNGAKAVLEAAVLTPVEFTNPTDGGYKYSSAAKDTNILDVARAALGDASVTLALAESFVPDALIAADGSISYPTDEAKEIVLPLTLSYNGQSAEASVSAVIPRHALTKAEEIAAVKAALADYMNDPKVLNGNASLDEVKTTLLLPAGKSSGLYIKWTSNNTKVIANQTSYSKIVSSHGHPTNGYYESPIMRPGSEDATVTLTAELTYRSTSVDLAAGPLPAAADRKTTFTVKVPALTEAERKAIVDGAAADVKLVDKDGDMADLMAIADNLYFPSYSGFTTKWTSDVPGLSIPSSGYGKATVSRPELGADDLLGTVTLTISAGEVQESKTFDVKVLAWTEPELESARTQLNEVAEALTFDAVKGTNASSTTVTSNLFLKRFASFSDGSVALEHMTKSDADAWPVAITWEISPADGPVVYNDRQANKGTGIVSTPAQDTEVALKATIDWRSAIPGVSAVEKTLTVTVLGAETADYLALMDGIAAKYAASGVAESDQAPWFAADMAAYAKLFPDSANKLSDAQKQAMVDLAIEKLASVTKPGDAAQYILALVALGCDPTQLTTAKLEALNAVETLDALSFGPDGSVTDAAKNPYTLPYVMIAYQQFGSTYQAQLDKLLALAAETKAAWLDSSWGADAATPMILALAPYSAEPSVAAMLEEAKAVLAAAQFENGALGSYGSGSATSTGLGIVACAALGIDPKTVVKGEKHLMDGLMAYAEVTGDGFEESYGSFNTEQGFRGLVAYHGFKASSPYRIYDFSGQSLVPAAATESWAENCGVHILATPAEATVNVAGQTAFKSGCYDLAAGEYTYTVSLSGYVTKTESFTVSDEDVAAGTKTLLVALSPVSGGGVSGKINTTISVANPYGGYYQAEKSCSVDSGTTAAELLLSLGLNVVSNSHAEYGFYVESINGVGEFDLGSGSGWMYKVNGEFPATSADNYVLSAGDRIEWVYTRNVGGDVGGGSSVGGSVKEEETTLSFTDVAESDYFFDAVKWAAEKGLTTGTGEGIFSPEAVCSRAQMVTFLWRAAGSPKAKNTACGFTDADESAYYYEALLWAVENDITSGTSATTFSPDAVCTRSQMAAFLYRSAKSPAAVGEHGFADVAEDAYYNDAVIWAAAENITRGTGEGTFSPDAVCTRAQMVTFLYRYLVESAN